MLDLTRIKYFQAVAEAGSFSRAARRLGVSQPTLSIQVARLEEELGTPLFRRHRNGVTLNEVGRRLFAQCPDLFAQVTAMERTVRSQVEIPTGDLRIATVNSVGIYVLPEALALFTRRFPKVRPTTRFEHSDVVTELLEEGDIDVAVTAQMKKPPMGISKMIIDDPLVLVCGRDHPLARRRYVRAKDLDGEKLIAFDDESPTAKVIDKVLARHKVKMDPIIKTPQIAAMVRMVRMNMGLAFLPQLALQQELEGGGLNALDFAVEDLHRGIWLTWTSEAEFPARDAFVDCMQEAAQQKIRAAAL